MFDRLSMRLSLWSPQFELIETRPLRVIPGYGAYYLPDGSVLTSGRQPAPHLAGRPVVLMDSAGQPAPGFNAHGDPYPAIDEEDASRRLTMSGDTAFWSAHVDRYEVHLWSLDSRLLRTLRGSVDWFPDDAGEPPPGAPPPPRLVSLWEEGGVMWMLVIVPDIDIVR